jgi:hypothetical protein
VKGWVVGCNGHLINWAKAATSIVQEKNSMFKHEPVDAGKQSGKDRN